MGENIAVFAAAGFRSAPNFMQGVLERIKTSIIQNRPFAEVIADGLLFPYGDWSRSGIRQLLEIQRDIRLLPHQACRSIGGQRMVQEVMGALSALSAAGNEVGKLLLIGHSGGGVACVQAAEIMTNMVPAMHIRVVQVGSPKTRLSANQQEHTTYLYAMDSAGRVKDAVCRLGSWGGWEHGKTRLRLRRWNPLKYAPQRRYGIPLIGGHPDYFRERVPFIHRGGQSNLDMVMEHVAEWFVNLRP